MPIPMTILIPISIHGMYPGPGTNPMNRIGVVSAAIDVRGGEGVLPVSRAWIVRVSVSVYICIQANKASGERQGTGQGQGTGQWKRARKLKKE